MAEVTSLKGFETVGSQEQLAVLYAKLSAVMAGIERIPKNGRHPQGYNYVLESDMAEAIRGLLVENSVMFFMSDDESEQREVLGRADRQTGERSANVITDTKFWMAFTCTDTGALIAMSFRGEGMDNQDKGYAKSSTLAMKYFLMRIFLVPSGMDADDPSDRPAPQRAAAPSRPAANDRTPLPQYSEGSETEYPEDGDEPLCPEHGKTTWKVWPDGGMSCQGKVNGQFCPWRVSAKNGELYRANPKR